MEINDEMVEKISNIIDPNLHQIFSSYEKNERHHQLCFIGLFHKLLVTIQW